MENLKSHEGVPERAAEDHPISRISGRTTEKMQKLTRQNVIGESNNFRVSCDAETKAALQHCGLENLAGQFEALRSYVCGIFGSAWEGSPLRVRLFSNPKVYQQCLSSEYPTIPKDSATFDSASNTILSCTPAFPCDLNQYAVEMRKRDISEKDVKRTYISNLLAGPTHEMAHMHPFFGAVGNRGSRSKWEQEMACVFVDTKVHLAFGNERHLAQLFSDAHEKVLFLQREKRGYSWGRCGTDWSKVEPLERFIYPWLEKKFGMEKLRNLWAQLFKEKIPLSQAVQKTFGVALGTLERQFIRHMSKATSFNDVISQPKIEHIVCA